MEPVLNEFPQAHVTVVSKYFGWMLLFIFLCSLANQFGVNYIEEKGAVKVGEHRYVNDFSFCVYPQFPYRLPIFHPISEKAINQGVAREESLLIITPPHFDNK